MTAPRARTRCPWCPSAGTWGTAGRLRRLRAGMGSASEHHGLERKDWIGTGSNWIGLELDRIGLDWKTRTIWKEGTIRMVWLYHLVFNIKDHCNHSKTFLESWAQTGSETYIFCSKIPIWKLDLYDPGLTWPFSIVYFSGVIFKNVFDFWILRAKVPRKHVSHAR